jgi:hypothetical protein
VSSDNVSLGHEAKIRINGEPYAVVGGQLRVVAQEHDTSDTEGGDFENARAGLRRLECDLEAQASTDVSPFVVPLNLNEGAVVFLQVYPHGLGAAPYESRDFLVLEFTHAFPVRQPQSFRLRGRSKHEYFKPG